jgi:ATP-binding cassette subfamily E protein 1
MQRIAVVDREVCKPDKCGVLCRKVCPKVRSGEECVVLRDKIFIDENICIGCGLCVKACDKAGFKALSIINLPSELRETPIHRFGPNEFVLYRLPFPSTGQIVGLIGQNGVGKTTALRILSGELKPNLGEFGKEADVTQLVKLFRGTELQSYIEKLESKNMRTSYKPQRVDQLPKIHKGKISNLLKKTDERGILNNLIESFDIASVLDKKISEISGGELQRVAIAACLARDADIYYLDEPTSFLDVFQRLAIARVIRDACKDRAVMIVDHDLATLDFLADRVHIFYGSPGVYGIVSKPYGVRVGINTFLDGYIKEDNVRIRPEPITFATSFIKSEPASEILIQFRNLKKKYEKFGLEIEHGDMRRKEVLVVLGSNALGKTTFAKILAGELEAEGEISHNVKISYKPQYITTEFSGTVRKILSSISDIETENFTADILRPLGLEKLLEKKIKDLSGGELQRVAIACCLSRQADVYLLDEPSAFLDVEQRLAVAKLVNKKVEVEERSALIIDHDLLFLSKLGDRAMLFLGKPTIHGHVTDVTSVKNAFNTFLKEVGVTFRRDPQTGRPRANKLESKLDREQKESGNYFYV